MKSIKIGPLVLGDRVPKICISNTVRSEEEILDQAEKIKNSPASMMEWRVDCFESVYSEKVIFDILGKIKEKTEDLPILFTFRSSTEGGQRMIDDEEYFALNQTAVHSGMVQMLDVEYNRGKEILSKLSESCEESHVICLASYHDFIRTPDEKKMLDIADSMLHNGADICKLAVMPQTDKDVLKLLSVSEILGNEIGVPHVAISMGEKGMISRIYAGKTGSVITFAALDHVSAPGQIEAGEMKKILQILY